MNKMYMKKTCPYCQAAVLLLGRNQIQYEMVDVLQIPPEDWEKICQETGMRTVPQVFLENQLVGGYTELLSKARQENWAWQPSQ